MVKKLFMALMLITAGINFTALACDMSGKERALLAQCQAQQSQEAVEVTPEIIEVIARTLLMDQKFARNFTCVPTAVILQNEEDAERRNEVLFEIWNPERKAVSSRSCSRNN
jgi:hypothetical protein